MTVSSSTARLVALPGDDGAADFKEKEHWLSNGGPTTIGRAETCTVHIACPTVSGIHCRIRLEPGAGYVVEDCSSNGTFIEAATGLPKYQIGKGKSARLADQDVIVLAKRARWRYRFLIEHGTAPAEVPPSRLAVSPFPAAPVPQTTGAAAGHLLGREPQAPAPGLEPAAGRERHESLGGVGILEGSPRGAGRREERARLEAQSDELQNDLAQRRSRMGELQQQVACRRQERASLQAALDATLEDLAKCRGRVEAFQIHAAEASETAHLTAVELALARRGSEALTAQLEKVQREAESARSCEASCLLRIERQDAGRKRLVHLILGLAQTMQRQAASLEASVEACGQGCGGGGGWGLAARPEEPAAMCRSEGKRSFRSECAGLAAPFERPSCKGVTDENKAPEGQHLHVGGNGNGSSLQPPPQPLRRRAAAGTSAGGPPKKWPRLGAPAALGPVEDLCSPDVATMTATEAL